MNSQEHRRVARAFTLVELLVVIGIVSTLMAMLVPALTAARRSALQMNCASNLRQCAMGLRLYAIDNRDALPYRPKPQFYASTVIFYGNWNIATANSQVKGWGACAPDSLANSVHFAGNTLPYFKTMKVWGCPSVGAPAPDDLVANQYSPGGGNPMLSNYQAFWWYIDTTTGYQFSSGGPNVAWPGFGVGNSVPSKMTKVSAIAISSEFPLLQDTVRWNGTVQCGLANHPTTRGVSGGASGRTVPSSGEPTATLASNQSDSTCFVSGGNLAHVCRGANIAFYDGHVDWRAGGELISAGPELNTDGNAKVYTYFHLK